MPSGKLVLASRSPRRRALLEMLGIAFVVDVEHIEEHFDETLTPDVVVENLAVEKAEPVSARNPESLVLAADTVVVLDDEILGKPESSLEASDMLRRLSARTHTVFTGIALVHEASQRSSVAHSATDVTFSPLSDEEIAEYVAGGSPFDKAGAYGIQDDRGCLFVSRIEGDYYNVVGLPLNLLYNTLRRDFPDLAVL